MDTNVAHTSQGLSLTGRELVTPDELMRWPTDQVLCWQAGYPPARLALPDFSAWSIFPDLQQREPWEPPTEPVPEVPIFQLATVAVIQEGKADKAGKRKVAQGIPERRARVNPAGESIRGGDHKVDIPVSEMGGLGDLFFQGQQAAIDPSDLPEGESDEDTDGDSDGDFDLVSL